MSSIFRILQTSRPRLYNILKELASFFFSSKAEDPGVTSGIIIVEKLPPLPRIPLPWLAVGCLLLYLGLCGRVPVQSHIYPRLKSSSWRKVQGGGSSGQQVTFAP